MPNILKYLILIFMCLVIITGFVLPIPYIPALEEKARIIYFHVPMSWLAVLAFFMSMVYSVKYLRTKNYVNDIKAYSAAEIGFLFCILATVTGALWAKFSWGSFWNWDPRQTSIFILLLVYGAYFSLRSAIDEAEQKARLCSVYSIIAFVTVPFFIFIMPRLIETLHPDPIINTQGKINMDSVMLIIFISSLFTFTLLYFWIFNIKVRFEKLKSKKITVN
ncbi:cytochrome c biogenesis protein [Bacteroidota bacterium]